MNGLAGHVAGLRAADVVNDVGHILRHALAPDWRRAFNPLASRMRALAADLARHDAIDGDAMSGEFARQTAGQADKARFRRHDMRTSRRAQMRADAADIDDAPVFLPHHGWQDRPCAQKGTIEDRPGDSAPLRQGHVCKSNFAPHGCIVDENVDAARFGEHALSHGGHGSLVRDIGEVDESPSTGRLDLGDGCFSFIFRAQRVDDDSRAVPGQRHGDGLADPAHATRDNGDLSLKGEHTLHVSSAVVPLRLPVDPASMLRDANLTPIARNLKSTKQDPGAIHPEKTAGTEAMGGASDTPISDITRVLAAYISGAPRRELPAAVSEKTRFHILDTLAAILSGSRLRAGMLATKYVAPLDGAGVATVIGSALRVPPESAALANGMAGHGDETDDSHLEGRFHPGCGILPAALAIAEVQNASGADFVRAIALGYDIGARLTLSLGLLRPDASKHSTHSLAPAFGAAAAGAALFRLSEEQTRHVLSYAAQQASGIPFWQRDTHHVEKAFDFGGMAARNGVASAAMVAAGFTAVDDPLSGRHNLFTAFGEEARPDLLIEDLGVRHEIMRASIKKWCVGSPIQAILDATTALVAEHGLKAGDVLGVTITMPDDRFHIVDNRTMPDICAQHLCALAIADGGITFESTHDHARMEDPAILALRARITLTPDAELTRARPARQAIVEIRTATGVVRHHARAVRGTPDNPMTAQEIEAKALDLVTPIIGAERGGRLVDIVRDLENLPSMRDLRPLLMA